MDSSGVTSIHAIISYLGMLLFFGLPVWIMMFSHFSKEKKKKEKIASRALFFEKHKKLQA